MLEETETFANGFENVAKSRVVPQLLRGQLHAISSALGVPQNHPFNQDHYYRTFSEPQLRLLFLLIRSTVMEMQSKTRRKRIEQEIFRDKMESLHVEKL